MSNNKQSSIDFYRIESQKLMIKAIRKEITEKEWRLSENKLGEQARAMHKEEQINTFKHAQVLMVMDSSKRAEQWYNETFGE